MRTFFIILFQIPLTLLLSQPADTIDLQSCYDLLEKNYPLFSQKDIIIQSSSLQQHNYKSAWNPQLNLSGQATYQNEVTEVQLPDILLDNLPYPIDMPTAPLDQYKLAIDIQQNIYDGGLSKKQVSLEQANENVYLQQLAVELNKLKGQVNTLYFNALLLQESLNLIQNHLNELLQREKTVISGVENGVLLQADHDELKAEMLKIEQSIFDLQTQNTAIKASLAKLLKTSIDDSAKFELTNMPLPSIEPPNRPENLLFQLQVQQLDVSKDMLGSKRRPRVYAFGQTGYGRPGFNMLSDEFSPFYIVGVGMKWNIWDWGSTNREKQIIELNQLRLQSNEDAFNTQLNITLEQQAAFMESLVEAAKQDKEIIRLRENISNVAKSQMDNGTITTTDYLHKLNTELSARIEYARHIIQLEQTKANYLLLKGEL
ncbi:MAG: TolC family protein [Bacteroidales bacterium]|nr:TolC family protein [Bacteroidales bacterium]